MLRSTSPVTRDRIFFAVHSVTIDRLGWINEASLPEHLEKAFRLSLPALSDAGLVNVMSDAMGRCKPLQLFLGMVPLQ